LWKAVSRTRVPNIREKQEAEKRQIASRELAEFQDSVAASMSEELSRGKGIEITEEIVPAMATKVCVVGSRDDRLLVIQDARWIPGMILF
jgi:hypothetical protein